MGMARARNLVSLLALSLATGCSTVPTGTTVRIAMRGEKVPRHEVVAMIDTTVGTGGVQFTAPAERARAMAESAARAAGADLVILIEEEDVSEQAALVDPAHIHIPKRRYRWNLAKTATAPAPSAP